MINPALCSYEAIYKNAQPGDIVVLRNVHITGFICGVGYRCTFIKALPGNRIEVDLGHNTTNSKAPISLTLPMKYVNKIHKFDTRELIFEHSYEDAL